MKKKSERYQRPTYRRSETKPFGDCWSIEVRTPQYDALADPHASCYFMNQSMRKHLLGLQKTIVVEGKHTERAKINSYIHQRIEEIQKVGRRPAEEYFKKVSQQPSNSQVKSHEKRKTPTPNGKNYETTAPSSIKNKIHLPKLKKPNKSPYEIKINKDNQTAHNKLMKFIEKKKKILTTEGSVEPAQQRAM